MTPDAPRSIFSIFMKIDFSSKIMGHGHLPRRSMILVESLDFLGSLEIPESFGIPRNHNPQGYPRCDLEESASHPSPPQEGCPKCVKSRPQKSIRVGTLIMVRSTLLQVPAPGAPSGVPRGVLQSAFRRPFCPRITLAQLHQSKHSRYPLS